MRRYLALAAAIAAGCAHAPAKKPPASPKKEETRPLSMHVQRDTSYHEAAHAIVCLVTDARPKLISVYVGTRLGEDGNYGRTINVHDDHLETAEDYRDDAACFMGGRAGDEVFLGAPRNGATRDLGQITERFTHMYLKAGLGFTLMSHETPTKKEVAAIEREMDRAYDRAVKIVRKNRKTVEELAELIMKQPDENGRRTVWQNQFYKFLEGRRLFDESGRRIPRYQYMP